jgi:orotidine-5'-phosphate decarboxylase
MIPEEKIIVALDTSEAHQLEKIFLSLEGHKCWVKIGMELFYSLGPDVIYLAHEKGLKIFLDLKLHDIPTTVSQSLKTLGKLPINMINVHASGGSEMMKRASDALKEASPSLLLLAVTQLTSTTQEQLNQEQRIAGDVLESVIHYAKLAKDCGLDGVVSSPLEVPAIKLTCGSRFLTVSPGIRPLHAPTQDQKRFTTPLEAIHNGCDFLVIGRPITQASDPKMALKNILQGK